MSSDSSCPVSSVVIKHFVESLNHTLPGAGSWSLENYKERIENMKRSKLERQQLIQEYLQEQNIDQVNY